MALPATVKTLEDVPEGAREHYTPGTGAQAGSFVLGMEGAHPLLTPTVDVTEAIGKVKEFRENNVALMAENDVLKKTAEAFNGIDVNAARAALAKVDELGKKGVKDTKDLDERIAAAMKEATTPLVEQLKASDARLAAADAKVKKAAFDTSIAAPFLEAGGKASAKDFIIGRAEGVFEIVDDTIVAKTGQYSPNRAGEPITVAEWLEAQTKEVDFAFGSSVGGDTRHNGKDTLPAGVVGLRNLTPMQLGDPKIAKALRERTATILDR